MTAHPSDVDALAAFFDRFDDAFSTFSGVEIAARYSAPYLACRSDGSAECFPTPESIADYFQQVLDRYRQSGIRSCSHSALSIDRLDPRHVLATVTWHLAGSERPDPLSWRESYLVVHSDGELLIRSSIDHV